MIKDGLLHGKSCTHKLCFRIRTEKLLLYFPPIFNGTSQSDINSLGQTEHRTNINEHTVLFRNLRLL